MNLGFRVLERRFELRDDGRLRVRIVEREDLFWIRTSFGVGVGPIIEVFEFDLNLFRLVN